MLASLRNSVEMNSAKIDENYLHFYKEKLKKILLTDEEYDFLYKKTSINFICSYACENTKFPFIIELSSKDDIDEDDLDQLFFLINEILNIKLNLEQKNKFYKACRIKDDRFYLRSGKFDIWVDFSRSKDNQLCNFTSYIARKSKGNSLFFNVR